MERDRERERDLITTKGISFMSLPYHQDDVKQEHPKRVKFRTTLCCQLY